MVDPISALCTAGLVSVVKALADGAVGTTVSGIVGNRADWVFCKLMGKTSEHFLKNARLSENHDLFLGMIDAHQRSIAYVAETVTSQARDAREQLIAKKIVAIAKRPITGGFEAGTWLMPLITPLIAGPGEDATGMRGTRMVAAACEILVGWFEHETDETLPEHLRRLFSEPAPNGRAPWQDIFRLYLTEAIKTNPRFERIFLASNVAEIAGRTITIQAVIIELEKGLAGLQTQLGMVATDVKQILEIQAAQVDQINRVEARLLSLFNESPLAAKARKANVDAKAFVLLARKINLEVDDESQALNELNRAVEELLNIKATADCGESLDTLVNKAMKKIAEQSLRGEFDSAAAEAATAFADWERREAEQRAAQRQSGLTLINANIQQHLLRRDSVSAAGWIERRVSLERGGKSADASSLLLETEIWYDRGRDRGLNLDLAVAIALSRRAFTISTTDDKGAALIWLGNALSTLGERESGTQRLDEAAEAYREALQERTRERVPLQWAMTQNNLGNALSTLGERESGTQRLDEAVEAYRDALKEYSRERVPHQWELTQKNLGLAQEALTRKQQSET